MKKILALVLAVAMLSTTAFAATVTIAGGDDPIAESVAGEGVSTVPGTTLRIYPNAFGISAAGLTNVAQLDNTATDWRLCNEYFTVSAKKFSKGANLVKEVKINDDEATVDIILKDDFALSAPKAPNLVIDNLSIKAKKEYKKNGKGSGVSFILGDIKSGATYKYKGLNSVANTADSKTVPATITVGYDTAVGVALDNSPAYLNQQLVKFVAVGDVNYETASLNVDDVYIEGRVYNKDKCYVGIDHDINKEVLKLDETASMRFVNVTTNGLPTANTLKITAEENEFIYKIVDNKIVASGLKWNADDSAFVGKIRSSANYVISDIELKAAPAVEGDKPATTNPDTGANDVVGIAAALAVVSLVAAGAVSMKK